MAKRKKAPKRQQTNIAPELTQPPKEYYDDRSDEDYAAKNPTPGELAALNAAKKEEMYAKQKAIQLKAAIRRQQKKAQKKTTGQPAVTTAKEMPERSPVDSTNVEGVSEGVEAGGSADSTSSKTLTQEQKNDLWREGYHNMIKCYNLLSNNTYTHEKKKVLCTALNEINRKLPRAWQATELKEPKKPSAISDGFFRFLNFLSQILPHSWRVKESMEESTDKLDLLINQFKTEYLEVKAESKSIGVHSSTVSNPQEKLMRANIRDKATGEQRETPRIGRGGGDK